MRRDRLRNWERAGQWHTKCTWSSGPEPHSLQVGSRLDKVELRLDELKRQTSDSRPWHPTSRRILKLFNLVSFGSPRVTNQCGMGLPSWMSSHSESGRREQSFRKLDHVISSALGRCAREEETRDHHSRYLLVHRISLDLHSRPPHCLRVATIATMVAHSILMDGQGFPVPFLATQIFKPLVSRRARPIFRMRIRQRGKSPHKILRNLKSQKSVKMTSNIRYMWLARQRRAVC